jgi:nitrogen fixation NifU-like protein
MTAVLYRDRILDHFRHPRHRGGLDEMDAVGRGRIPLCGDEVEVGIRASGEGNIAVRFRGRGCALCVASASMMAEALSGLPRDSAERISTAFLDWMLERKEPMSLADDAPDLVETFAPAREAGARAQCAALPWGALREALERV